MKAQSFQVRDLKNKIAACLRLIALNVKSAVLRLLDMEQQLELAMRDQLNIIQKYAPGVVRGSRLSEKNSYRKQQQARHDMNEVLKNNGFHWVKVQKMDITQGETGEFFWSLEDLLGNVHQPLAALCRIYSQETAILIPRSGGKLKELSPDNSFNIIRNVIEYGVA